jgi:hypothetical protein
MPHSPCGERATNQEQRHQPTASVRIKNRKAWVKTRRNASFVQRSIQRKRGFELSRNPVDLPGGLGPIDLSFTGKQKHYCRSDTFRNEISIVMEAFDRLSPAIVRTRSSVSSEK